MRLCHHALVSTEPRGRNIFEIKTMYNNTYTHTHT